MNRAPVIVLTVAVLGVGLAAGYWLGHRAPTTSSASVDDQKILYWYDPMKPDQHFDHPGKSPFMDMQLVPKMADSDVAAPEKQPLYWYDPMKPDQHFDHPGKSPFMDMQLVPKYSDGDSAAAGSVRIDPTMAQNLGMRTATVELGALASGLRVPATIGWDLRQVTAVSARADGVIDKLYVRAPFEHVTAGQPLASLIAPEWNSAAQEYLALGAAQSADGRALHSAAHDRLRALGMDDAQIRDLGRGGGRIVLRAPTEGVVSTLDAREGQRLSAGMPILTINGLHTVWLDAAIPQGQAGGIVAGTSVVATVSARPGETFRGRVEALLPDIDATTRTQHARIVLDNPNETLAPGMFAELQLQSGGDRNVLLVPDEAVIATGMSTRVIVAEANGRFRPVAVRTGLSSDGKTEILAGLRSGERVVVSGQFLIDSEASLSGALERMEPVQETTELRP
jgi:Cu(I)/Ag(I) efflux system membrane fusion protein